MFADHGVCVQVLYTSGDKVTIQYIDYGDQETKLASEVFPLRPEFAKLPQLGTAAGAGQGS